MYSTVILKSFFEVKSAQELGVEECFLGYGGTSVDFVNERYYCSEEVDFELNFYCVRGID